MRGQQAILPNLYFAEIRRLGDNIGIMTERLFGWTFPARGPHNQRETYPREIIGIFADKVA
jgi:hypothetical protein